MEGNGEDADPHPGNGHVSAPANGHVDVVVAPAPTPAPAPAAGAAASTATDVPVEHVKKAPGGHDEGELDTNFVHSHGLTSAEAHTLLLEHGRNELMEKTTHPIIIYLRGLWGPMPIAIWIAVIVEFALQNYPDGAILLGILFANATISFYETMKAGNAVAALKKSLKPNATVKRDGNWSNIDAALVVPGDLVLLASGSAVPADCLLHKVHLDIDESALTGESLPVAATEGFVAKMGSNVVRGEGEATVYKTGMKTFFGETARLLQAVGVQPGSIQILLLHVMIVLTSLSLVLCIIAFIYLMVKVREPVSSSLEFTVVLLVASIPMAIEIVVTTTLAAGSRELTQWKAIVTKLSAIEALAGMNMLCSDKTGTLTLNQMEIQDDCPTFLPGYDKASCLVLAALAAKWKEPPRDALDRMVLGAVDLKECDKYTQLEYAPFDPVIKRTEATITGPDGVTFKVTKGAPHVVLELCHDKERISHEVHDIIDRLGAVGTRCLSIAKTNVEGQWEMVGILTFLDPPRPDTKETIERAWHNGVYVKMITGDHLIIAKEMGRRLGLGSNIMSATELSITHDETPGALGKLYGPRIFAADGFAQVFPEHKFLIVESLRQYGFTCGMTGDGVNDAPALKRADIGIAVSGATDAARAAADIVLTAPGLSVIIEAITIARGVFNRIKSFMIYRIAATLQLVSFFFIAIFALPPANYQPYDIVKFNNATQTYVPAYTEQWPEFFSIPVLMLMLITLLNDGTLLTIGYDNVKPSKRPQKWNLPALFVLAAVLAGVACLSSLILLYGALDSWSTDGWFHRWGLPPMPYGKVVSMMYLKVSVSDFLTLFSSRVQGNFFFTTRPARILLIGAFIALSCSTILATLWPDGSTSGITVMGLSLKSDMDNGYTLWPLWVWLYCLGWWIAQDAAKVAVYHVMSRYDIFKFRTLATVMANNKFHVADDGPKARAANAAIAAEKDERMVGRLETLAEAHHTKVSATSIESQV